MYVGLVSKVFLIDRDLSCLHQRQFIFIRAFGRLFLLCDLSGHSFLFNFSWVLGGQFCYLWFVTVNFISQITFPPIKLLHQKIKATKDEKHPHNYSQIPKHFLLKEPKFPPRIRLPLYNLIPESQWTTSNPRLWYRLTDYENSVALGGRIQIPFLY